MTRGWRAFILRRNLANLGLSLLEYLGEYLWSRRITPEHRSVYLAKIAAVEPIWLWCHRY